MTAPIYGFSQLFAGRTDAYGTEEGGCDRKPGKMVLEKHLGGGRAIGVYPMVEEFEYPDYEDGQDAEVTSRGWFVSWGCVDFDIKSDHHKSYDYETEDAAHEAARTLYRALGKLGIRGWIERTRSHGRHVWLFAERAVPAWVMRRCLLVACDVAGVSTREVNPKQETLIEGQLGNYVRLPYFAGMNRVAVEDFSVRVMLNEGPGDFRMYEPYPLGVFVEQALDNRAPQATLEKIAALYVPPPIPEAIQHNFVPYTGGMRELTRKLDGLGYVVFKDGPKKDRSAGLFTLACSCSRSGLSYDHAMTLLKDADARWGKFSKRADCDKRLGEIVSRAYG